MSKTPAKSPARAEPKDDLDRFVALVRAKLPDAVIDRRDEEIAGMGELTCDWLAAGRKDAAVVAEIGKQGLTAPDAGVLLRLARDTACPT